jgi:hypothetical protein
MKTKQMMVMGLAALCAMVLQAKHGVAAKVMVAGQRVGSQQYANMYTNRGSSRNSNPSAGSQRRDGTL